MNDNEEEKAIIEKPKPKKSVKETITLMMRKRWLASTTQTLILVAVLVAIFLAINLYCQSIDLPEIDVTDNKIYTLSDSSKEAVRKINKDVKIYAYGYEENATLISFLKQYVEINNHISYEILTEESNLAKVQEYELSQGYQIVILESGDSKKVIDASYEFYSYDYEIGQEVDLTEQTLTNSLLAITVDVKPKVYFTTGHEEYAMQGELGVLSTYLTNEAYEPSELNILTTGKVPEDCSVLAIMSPYKDFMESEANAVLDYINKGGKIVISFDTGNINENYTNLRKIYDAYGVTMEDKGFVYETDATRIAANYPIIFMPNVISGTDITSDIYSENGQVWLVRPGRLKFKSDEELTAMNVTKQELLTSSEKAKFVTDLSESVDVALANAEEGQAIIAALMTKTITPATEKTETEEAKEAIESKMVVIANGAFITDNRVEALDANYPISYLGNNKDFVLNSISTLTDREDTLKIRKDMSSSTYQPTQEEHTIVIAIIFAAPVIIIVAGIVVWNVRRRKR